MQDGALGLGLLLLLALLVGGLVGRLSMERRDLCPERSVTSSIQAENKQMRLTLDEMAPRLDALERKSLRLNRTAVTLDDKVGEALTGRGGR